MPSPIALALPAPKLGLVRPASGGKGANAQASDFGGVLRDLSRESAEQNVAPNQPQSLKQGSSKKDSNKQDESANSGSSKPADARVILLPPVLWEKPVAPLASSPSLPTTAGVHEDDESSSEKSAPSEAIPQPASLPGTLPKPQQPAVPAGKAALSKAAPINTAPIHVAQQNSPAPGIHNEIANSIDFGIRNVGVSARTAESALPAEGPVNAPTPSSVGASSLAPARTAFSITLTSNEMAAKNEILASNEIAASNEHARPTSNVTPADSAVAPQGTNQSAAVTFVEQAGADTQPEHHSSQSDGEQSTPYVAYEQAAAPASASSISEQPASSAAPASAPAEPDQHASRTEPVSNIRLQLTGSENERVDVRLMSRGGELHVNVKSADTTLTRALQDRIPELTSKLQEQFKTEVWIPRTPANSESNPSKSDGFAGGSGRQNSDTSGRQQRRNQDDAPKWLDELENGRQGIANTRRNQT